MSFKFYILKAALPRFLDGVRVTLSYTVVAVALAIVWGVLIGSIIHWRIPVLSRVTRWYVTFFRETPLLVQMYVIFYGLPQIGVLWSASVCGVLALVYCRDHPGRIAKHRQGTIGGGQQPGLYPLAGMVVFHIAAGVEEGYGVHHRHDLHHSEGHLAAGDDYHYRADQRGAEGQFSAF